MFNKKKLYVFIAFFITTVLGLSSWVISETSKKDDNELYRQVEILSDAITIVQEDYVDQVLPKDLIYGALKGMLASLDPHSQFMDPDTYNELKVDTEGKFGGLGIEITLKDGLLTVISPLEDTPAWKAGVKPGDIIVKINNDITRDITITDAVKKLRGKPGEAVNITVLRESEKKLIDFKIVRDIIKIKDIKETRILEDNIGYIRLVEFRENTTGDFKSALSNLKKNGMNALILDLRNNPGGLLDIAVKVSEIFIPKNNLIVSTKGRRSSQNMEFVSRNPNPLTGIPIVILINEGSASGSEIVAAALKDYKLAVIVGIKSFGKGSVQTVIPLKDGSALRLTTSKYFSPLGKEIHGKGVIPDIVVEDLKMAPSVKEGETPLNKEEVFEQIDGKQKDKKDVFDYKSDNQIMRSIDIIKALRLYEK